MGFLLFLWQLPQNVAGWILSRFAEGRWDADGRYYVWRGPGSVCLGEYVIVSSPAALAHERGHRTQSRMLGPLYLPVIGVPSFLWCVLHSSTPLSALDYYSFYTEAWAEKIRRRKAKEA